MKNRNCQEEIKNNKYNAKHISIIKQKNVCDLIFLNYKPTCHIKKIDKKHYIKIRKMNKTVYHKMWHDKLQKMVEYAREIQEIVSDGEVFEVPEKEGNNRNKRSLRKIFTDLRYLINSNFNETDSNQQLFITLTYRENMQDDKKLYDDFRNFIKRLKNANKEDQLCYIAIMEPQGRGAWHCHLLLKTLNQTNLFIPHDDIEHLWGHGATTTERLACNNIGSYFVAYMSNAEIDETDIARMEIPPDDIKLKDGKKYIKGERLKWYPDYMQIYRHSKNVLMPEKIKLSEYDDPVDIAEEQFPNVTYQTLKTIEQPNRKILTVCKEQRRKSKTR